MPGLTILTVGGVTSRWADWDADVCVCDVVAVVVCGGVVAVVVDVCGGVVAVDVCVCVVDVCVCVVVVVVGAVCVNVVVPDMLRSCAVSVTWPTVVELFTVAVYVPSL